MNEKKKDINPQHKQSHSEISLLNVYNFIKFYAVFLFEKYIYILYLYTTCPHFSLQIFLLYIYIFLIYICFFAQMNIQTIFIKNYCFIAKC